MLIDYENQAVKTAIIALKEKAEVLLKNVKKEYLPIVMAMLDNVKSMVGLNIFGDEVVEITMQDILRNAKQYMVKGCNEVIALRQTEANCTIIFLSYAKDKELLPKESNNYVIIKGSTLSADVNELFQESNVVILK